MTIEKYIIAISVFITSLLSCSNNSKNVINTKKILISDISINKIDIEKQFNDVEFLQIDSSIFIPGIAKMIYDETKIYISDGIRMYVLDSKTGKALYSIDKRGNAGDEYLEITDFCVIDGNIVVLDRDKKKLLTYGHQGDFLSSIKLNVFASSLTSFDSNVILNNDYTTYGDSQKGKFTLVNMNDSTTSYFGKSNINKSNYMHIIGCFNFFSKDDKLFFYESFSPYVYSIQNNEMILDSEIRFANSPSDEFYDNRFLDIADFITQFNQNEYASGMNNYFCGNTNTIFKFRYNSEEYYCIYNNKNNSVNCMGGVYLYDDIQINNIYFNKNCAIANVSSYRLIDAMKNNNRIKNLVDKYNLSNTSNPILILMKNIE